MSGLFWLALLLQSVAEPVRPEVTPETEVVEEQPDPVTGEFSVNSYIQKSENAGAKPFKSQSMAKQFGGQAGIRQLTDRLVVLSLEDPRISEIFKGQDLIRLRRTLFEQFCYLLSAGCNYTGRDMRAAHANMGLERNDLNALVENLQQAMKEERIPFSAQNKLLAKLAPMEGAVLQR